MNRNSIGFTQQDHTTDGMEAIKRLFTPEFRNRLDAVIQFNTLDREVIDMIVDKFIMELEGQLEPKGVIFEVDKNARVWLANNGYDEKMGARPMALLIQEQVKKPLAEELLFGKLNNGGYVKLTEVNDKLEFEFDTEKEDISC